MAASLRLALMSWLALIALVASEPPPALAADSVPAGRAPAERADYDASDPGAPPVAARNLMARDRFWPYRVELREAWTPESGGRTLEAGSVGVLIRMVSPAQARVDFGRDGLHELPWAATDLLARAERVRRGELTKVAPNLLFAIGPRLVDGASDPPRPLRLEDVLDARAVLSVFADPRSQAFAELAASMAPLREHPGLLRVLYPQAGKSPEADPGARSRPMDWEAPIVLDFLAEPYTRIQLGADHPLPAVQLQTPEGRVLFRSVWKPEVAAELFEAVERALGPTQRRAAAPAG